MSKKKRRVRKKGSQGRGKTEDGGCRGEEDEQMEGEIKRRRRVRKDGGWLEFDGGWEMTYDMVAGIKRTTAVERRGRGRLVAWKGGRGRRRERRN